MNQQTPGQQRVLLDDQGQAYQLELYGFDGCVYCRRVEQVVQELGIQLEHKDILKDQQAKEDLLRIGGKRQVPCLVINGEALYESADIISFLKSRL